MRAMRIVAFLEATSFLALLVATYFKHSGDGELGVSILGPIHGALFIAYVGIAIWLREQRGWSLATLAWVIVGAIVPFGGYVVDWWLAKQMRAERTAA